jgi:glycosyl transferase family 25
MTLNEFVEKIYCINLDRRPDRWQRCEEIFKQHEIVATRAVAVDGKSLLTGVLPHGALGVLRSNLAVLRGAVERDMDSIAIFEDDIELDDHFNEKFDEYIKLVPKDWAFIYLGGSNKKSPLPVNEHISKLKKTYGAYAVIIRSSIFDTLINLLSKEDTHLDFVYARMHSKYPSYIMNPFLAWVRNDYSDINERFIDVSHLKPSSC